jgi:hypothetical protein
MHPSPPTVAKPTLAEKLGMTPHVSPLLGKLKKHGLATPEDIAAAAIDRGCWHYAGLFASEGMTTKDTSAISDEELAIALLSPCHPYEPMLIRVGSQMLSGKNSDPLELARLAIMERCESVLRYIAECGKKTEPELPFWQTILDTLPPCKPFPKEDVHISRFRIETGFTNPFKPNTPKVTWLRPLDK